MTIVNIFLYQEHQERETLEPHCHAEIVGSTN